MNATIAHELLHEAHFQEWHNNADPLIEFDFDPQIHQFDSCEECEEYRLERVEHWKKSWLDLYAAEKRHEHPDFVPAVDPGRGSGVSHSDAPAGTTLYQNDLTPETGHERFLVSPAIFPARNSCPNGGPRP